MAEDAYLLFGLLAQKGPLTTARFIWAFGLDLLRPLGANNILSVILRHIVRSNPMHLLLFEICTNRDEQVRLPSACIPPWLPDPAAGQDTW